MGLGENKEVGVVIDKFSVVAAIGKLLVLQHVFQKLDIGFDATDTEFL